MGRIKQAFTCGAFSKGGKTPMEELFAIAADIGYKGVDLPGGYPKEEMVKVAAKHGLTPCMIGGHGTLRDGLNKRENHDRIEQEIRANLDFAADNGVTGLVCFSGDRCGLDDYTGLLHCAEGLKRVAGYAEDKGVNLCVELLNSKVNHPDYQCDRSLWGVVLCEMVGSERVRLLNDLYHMQIMEGDLIRTVQKYGKYFAHYHTAGNPGRKDLDDQQEIYYPAVMRAIADTGYDMFVGHEFSPKNAEDPIAALKAAFLTCDV